MPRQIFLTGGAGFVGGATARLLRILGDEVVAVVRDPSKAGPLHDIGATVVGSDLSDQTTIGELMAGSEAVIHVAGAYRIGIPKSAHPAMYEANVAVTERVLDAAIEVGIPRIVAISTVNAYGNSRGEVRDETFERDPADGFVSYYDETKYLAHRAAAERVAAGAPIVTVLPGVVYGPRDHSGIGAQLEAAYHGRLPYIALGETGISPAYVDDLAAGIVAAMDRGRVGHAYVMAGENMRLADAIRIAAETGGRRPPRFRMPTALIRLGAGLLPNGGRLVGQPPNVREIVSAAAGVTYWASSAKAAAELGYVARPLSVGARDAYGRR